MKIKWVNIISFLIVFSIVAIILNFWIPIKKNIYFLIFEIFIFLLTIGMYKNFWSKDKKKSIFSQFKLILIITMVFLVQLVIDSSIGQRETPELPFFQAALHTGWFILFTAPTMIIFAIPYLSANISLVKLIFIKIFNIESSEID